MTASGSNLKVLRPLGADTVSEAFLASVPGFDVPKAVRLLKPELAQNEARAELFIAEARRLMDVRHPNLLTVHGAGRMRDGRVYAVTEYVEGPLLETAGRGSMKVEALVDVGIRLAGALGAVHGAGGLHGALTGHHVLLGADGPRLDFTFASVEREGPADSASDTHALAQVLLEAGTPVTGAAPFDTVLRNTVAAANTPAALASALDGLRSRWKESTAVSHPAPISNPQSDEPPEEPNLTGQTLGSYEVMGVVGEGAMGRVYRGRHNRLGRIDAIKVLKAEHARSRDLIDRFIQEAQAVNAIKNPHIVDIRDFGEELLPSGTPRVYCIMELLEGESLADLMDREPLTIQLATKVCGELARALGAAHQVGVVHRDVKPDNIFLVRKEKDAHYTKVLDFGVAKLLKPIGDLPRSGTQAGIVIGTPEYMAPEQALGQTTDTRGDIYSVGLVLYEILAGRRPFQGETFGQLVVEITTTPPPPLPATTARGEPIPAGLKAIVFKCLEKDAAHRFATAEALADALAAFAEGREVFPGAITAISSTHEELSAARPSPVPKLVAMALALALAAVGAWFALSPAPPAVVPAPVVVEVPAPPQLPRLDLQSTPPGAKVTRLDTQAVLGNTPIKLEVERQDTEVALRFELEGHKPVEQKVVLNQNLKLVVALEPVEGAGQPPVVAPPDPVVPKKPGKQKKVSHDGLVDPFAK